MLLKHFPNVTIYPTIGNHESMPVNMFPTPIVKNENISWLYDQIAIDWKKMIRSTENLSGNTAKYIIFGY
jgi:hypothetical protein